MNKLQESEMPQFCLDQAEDNNYYHLFCSFYFGYFRNLVNIKDFKLIKQFKEQ